jgi:hypothetical protein
MSAVYKNRAYVLRDEEHMRDIETDEVIPIPFGEVD